MLSFHWVILGELIGNTWGIDFVETVRTWLRNRRFLHINSRWLREKACCMLGSEEDWVMSSVEDTMSSPFIWCWLSLSGRTRGNSWIWTTWNSGPFLFGGEPGTTTTSRQRSSSSSSSSSPDPPRWNTLQEPSLLRELFCQVVVVREGGALSAAVYGSFFCYSISLRVPLN